MLTHKPGMEIDLDSKPLILLIICIITEGRVPCIDNCDLPKNVVCGFDQRLGARLFDNACILDSWNLCYRTDYEIQPTIGDCFKMYDEEYSREGTIPFKNPLVIQMYKNHKIDNLYL